MQLAHKLQIHTQMTIAVTVRKNVPSSVKAFHNTIYLQEYFTKQMFSSAGTRYLSLSVLVPSVLQGRSVSSRVVCALNPQIALSLFCDLEPQMGGVLWRITNYLLNLHICICQLFPERKKKNKWKLNYILILIIHEFNLSSGHAPDITETLTLCVTCCLSSLKSKLSPPEMSWEHKKLWILWQLQPSETLFKAFRFIKHF